MHVPFCARRCPYCDFDITVGRAPSIRPYLDGLAREIEARKGELTRIRPATLYVGGGTPSLLGVAGIAELQARVRPLFPDAIDEATIELNPEDVDDALVAAIVEHGFDRVSLGVQTFADAGLEQLGRMHDAARAHAAIARCVDAGLRTSVDVIVGWPHQRDGDLDGDLDAVLAAGVEHVSVYALTIEPGTPWPKLVRRGLRVLPDDDRQAELLVRAEARLVRAGLEHYEIASYARPSARARHNLGYWTWRDYVGLGPSAASAHHDDAGAVARRTNARGLQAWLEGDRAPSTSERLTGDDAAAEGLWLGLRVLGGLDVDAWLRRFPQVDRPWLERRVASVVARGDLQWAQGGRVLRVATRSAAAPVDPVWLRHDAIAADVLVGP